MRSAYNSLVRIPDGMRPLGKPRRRWEDNSRMHDREIGWRGVNWNHLAQDRDQWRAVVNTIRNLRFI
jgi:hypothetical protein